MATKGALTIKSEKLQLLTHEVILSVGDNIKDKFDKIAEHERQSSIRATEEVVRREEKQECARLLQEARSNWLEERESLLKECEEKRLQSVMMEKSTLECKLREEFDDRLAQIRLSHEEHLKESVSRTWSKAEQVKEEVIERVRAEEKLIAEQIANELAGEVQQEREELIAHLEEEKKKALSRQKEELEIEHKTQLLLHEQELQLAYEKKVTELCEQYETELMASQQLLEEKNRQHEASQKNLKLMTAQKEDFEGKYNLTRAEFSDFIAQFPGFNADFLLK